MKVGHTHRKVVTPRQPRLCVITEMATDCVYVFSLAETEQRICSVDVEMCFTEQEIIDPLFKVRRVVFTLTAPHPGTRNR